MGCVGLAGGAEPTAVGGVVRDANGLRLDREDGLFEAGVDAAAPLDLTGG
jgi:hypothetical protein